MYAPDVCRAQDADAGAAGLLFSTLPSFAGGALGFALAPHRFGEATFNVTDTSVSPVTHFIVVYVPSILVYKG